MVTQAFEDLADTFALLPAWEERYRHLIAMGKAMPQLEATWKVPAFQVQGCGHASWMAYSTSKGTAMR